MNEHDDRNVARKEDAPIPGDPMANTAAPHAAASPARTIPPGGRAGDPGLDLPTAGPIPGRPLTGEETRRAEAEKAAALEREYIEELDKLRGVFSIFSVPGWLRPLLTYPLYLFLAFVGTVTIAQTASGIAGVFALPSPLSWVMGGLLALLGAIALLICVRLLWLLFRLRRSGAWELAAHQQLGERRSLQESALRHRREAVSKLCAYLRGYDLGEKGRKKLEQLGLDAEDLKGLAEDREYLLQKSGALETGEWIGAFQNRFQHRLDRAAGAVVVKFSLKTSLSTALSPDPLLDRIIVLGMTMGMLTRLLELYGLRPSAAGAASLLTAAFSHTYLAGYVQDLSENIAEVTGDMLAEQVGGGAAKMTKLIGSKGGEAALHYLLVRRLGNAAIRQIQPTHR